MRRLPAALLLLLAACAHKPVFDTYRLRGPLLVPPGVAGPEVASRTIPAGIIPGKGSCAKQGPMLQLRRKRLFLTVDRDALLNQKQPGWLTKWTMQAEADGCIAQGEGVRLANLIAASVPLESPAVYRLLHVNDVQAGYVELGPENRLEVRSPVTQGEIATAGVTGSGGQLTVDVRSNAALAGFEIGWFAIRSNTGRPGVHFEPLSADRTTRNGVDHLAVPSVNYFQFPPEAAFFRLLYKTDDSGVIAVILAAPTREELDRRSAATCEQAGPFCITLPRRVGVNPFLVATVNEKEIAIRLDATVRTAIQAVGARPDAVLPTLTVSRLYAGQLRPVQFDRSSPDILNLKLNGGERLAWQE